MEPLYYKTQTRYLFHAHIKIKLPGWCDDDMFDDLFGIMENINQNYNSYFPRSYFSRMNNQAGFFVEVDNETIQILEKVISISDFFEGTYDITVMPLIRLWGFYKQWQDHLPTVNEINKILSRVNYRNIQMNGNRVMIGSEQEIVTGSFIKSYAANKVKERINELGVTDAIINAGGSTIIAVNNEIHPSWRIIVREPDRKEQMFLLHISNESYSTSEQSSFVEINGSKYGHILNPRTGYPSPNKKIGIVTEDGFIGDMLSTALFNETAEGFLKKIDALSSQYRVEGFLIDGNDRFTATSGFLEKYNAKTLSV